MAKNIRIVPASGSIFLKADSFDITGSIRLQTVGSTEDVQFINGETNESIMLIQKNAARVGIGTVSASAKLEISSSLSENVFLAGNASASITINNEGILKLSEYEGTPTLTSGGLYYSSSQFFVGI
jgi:hypothetical protein|tara:strand:- start:787 stop:1164 length:378 start_codon:yes stop_codon:yes gene_type:complete